jgi:hypothetical protein
MNDKHTPTPWYDKGCDIQAAKGIIAFCHSGNVGQSLEEARVNAAFIVKACNSHAALVAFARATAQTFAEDTIIGAEARAALAAAGEAVA